MVNKDKKTYKCRQLLLTISLLIVSILRLHAQLSQTDTISVVTADINLTSNEIHTTEDTLRIPPTESVGESITRRDWSTWKPEPKRAMWLALVIPGAGQIYNHKYWKLPIVYGGFVGCAYAMRWNNMIYHDYAQAYMDLLDNDPQTDSYNQFMHLGAEINSSNQARYEKLFKSRKDRFRRWRDMSFFVLVGVYAISVIDAYVDASLSEFDISDDLSLRIEPTVINDQLGRDPFKSNAIGLQCSVSF